MSGRAFTIGMEDLTIIADATLVFVHAESAVATQGSLLELIRAEAGQVGSDASDQIGISIGRKESAYPTLTTATPRPHAIGGSASGIVGGTSGVAGTCGVDASAEGAGTYTPIYPLGFNNLNGYLWVATPEERILIPVDQAVALKIDGTPTSLINWYASLTFLELM